MLQPSPRAHAMQVRHSHSGFAAESHDGALPARVSGPTALMQAAAHAVMINMDSAYDLPGSRPRPRRRHGLRGLLQLLRRRCGGMTLALAALAAILLLLRVSRGSCAASAASVRAERFSGVRCVCVLQPRLTRPQPRPAAQAHALELALAAGSEPVSGADTLHDVVIVAGHAVFTGNNFAEAGEQDSWCGRCCYEPACCAAAQGGPTSGCAFRARSFVSGSPRDAACFAALRRFLEEYQRVPGQVATFLEHMQARRRAPARHGHGLH